MSELSAVILAGGGGRRLGGVEKALLTLDGRTLLERLVAAVLSASSDLVVVSSRPEPLHGALERAGWTVHPVRRDLLLAPPDAAGREGARVRLVSERDPGAGPVAALEAGLGQVRTRLAWAVACDLAFPHPEVGRLLAAALPEAPTLPETPALPESAALAERAALPETASLPPTSAVSEPSASEPPPARAAVPLVRGRLQPLCAVYERPAAQTAAACLRDGRRRASDFLARLAISEVPEERFRSVGDPATLFLDIDTPEDLSRARHAARERAGR